MLFIGEAAVSKKGNGRADMNLGGGLRNILSGVSALAIALGLLPSLTALSRSIYDYFPVLTQYMGPLNPIKLALPVFIWLLFLERKKFSKTELTGFLGVLAILFLASAVAVMNCGFLPSIIRETFIIFTGLIIGMVFISQSIMWRRFVLVSWVMIIGLNLILDMAFPETLDFLNEYFFDELSVDYYRKNLLFQEVGSNVLQGLFGRQSLAKILVWVPFLVLAVFVKSFRKLNLTSVASWLLLLLATGLTMWTTQRAALLAISIGWCFLLIGIVFRVSNRKVFLSVLGMFAAGILLTLLLIPKEVYKARIEPYVTHTKNSSLQGMGAKSNASFRLRTLKFSIDHILQNPLGNACIPESDFYRSRIFPSHSHHMFIQQFRERGWLWGITHLILWMGALVLSAYRRGIDSIFLTAGIATVFVMGVFDHTWTVLNHASILGIYLGIAYMGRNE